jgi:hypothetical protein
MIVIKKKNPSRMIVIDGYITCAILIKLGTRVTYKGRDNC